MRLTKKVLLALLILDGAFLVLACTNFTAILWPWRHAWQCDYFQYAYRDGWGYQYVSDYGLAQVLSYLLAYGLGSVVAAIAWNRYRVPLSGFALMVCVLGTLSFAIESTHWLWDHHLSLIASFPIVALPLLVCLGAQLPRRAERGAFL